MGRDNRKTRGLKSKRYDSPVSCEDVISAPVNAAARVHFLSNTLQLSRSNLDMTSELNASTCCSKGELPSVNQSHQTDLVVFEQVNW